MRAALMLLAALAAEGTPTDAIRERDSEIRAALPPEGKELTEAARKRIEGIVSRIVDTRAMMEAAMGQRWAKLTPKQKKRLLEAFERRFRVAGGAQLETYRETRIAFLPEKREGEVVQVPTRLEVKGERTDVTYAMRQENGAWRIVDIVVDDVSTVENYRASFARIISREGVEALIERLDRGPDAKKS